MTNFTQSSVEKEMSTTGGRWRSRLKYLLSASFISLVLGFLGLYYTLRGSRTHLTLDIAAESNVLDVKHPIADLSILFQGRDIEEEKSNLEVLTIRLINDGEVNIHENDFDSRIPFGFQIDGGRVVRAQLSGSNSLYLSENLHPRVEEPNRVVVNKIIFDKEKFVSVDLLVLLPKNATPKVKPLGKIAGLDEIPITNSFQDRDQRGFLENAFRGPAAVQIARTLVYAFAALIALIAIGLSIAGISSIPSVLKRRGRRRIVARMPKLRNPESARKRKVVEDLFIRDGSGGVKSAVKLLGDQDRLAKYLKKYAEAQNEWQNGSVALDITGPENMELYRQLRPSTSIRSFIDAGLVAMNGDQAIIDPEAEALLTAFLEHLNKETKKLP